MEEKSNLYIVAIVGVVAVVAMVVLIMGMTTNVVPSSSVNADSSGQVTACQQLENSCYDSDGNNANVPGGYVRNAVCGVATIYKDSCIQTGPQPTNMSVLEYTCSGLSVLSQPIACPYGCLNGSCLTVPRSPAPVCGNGVKESGEACDSNSVDCGIYYGLGWTGVATCKSDCRGYNVACRPSNNSTNNSTNTTV